MIRRTPPPSFPPGVDVSTAAAVAIGQLVDQKKINRLIFEGIFSSREAKLRSKKGGFRSIVALCLLPLCHCWLKSMENLFSGSVCSLTVNVWCFVFFFVEMKGQNVCLKNKYDVLADSTSCGGLSEEGGEEEPKIWCCLL